LDTTVNEASLGDFKPSLKMVNWAAGDKDTTNANDYVKFATAIAQKWDELDDETKEKALEKWLTSKGKFKKEMEEIRAEAESDSPKAAKMKEVLASVAEFEEKARKIYDDKIEPMFAGSEKTETDTEALEKQLNDLKDQLEIANKEFAEARAKFDKKEVGWDQVQPAVAKMSDIGSQIEKIEGQLDKDA